MKRQRRILSSFLLLLFLLSLSPASLEAVPVQSRNVEYEIECCTPESFQGDDDDTGPFFLVMRDEPRTSLQIGFAIQFILNICW